MAKRTVLSSPGMRSKLLSDPLRPPAPLPRRDPLGPIALLRALWTNPLECWTEEHFQKPVVTTKIGLWRMAVVHDPAALRRVLVDNRANYRKDAFQRRVMSALGDGLLTAEGENWHVQRRMLAPIFTRKMLATFAPAMVEAANRQVERWASREGDLVDVAQDLTRLTLEVLERTIFSDGLGRDTETVRAAMRIYFDSIGRIDPFDLVGLPEYLPRLSRLGALSSLKLFRKAVDSIIATRRQRLEEGCDTLARDILTLLLDAKDPETGRTLGENGIKSNIITLIVAGHETTASALVWSLVLLARSPEWRERLKAEVAREGEEPLEDLPDRLPETRAVLEEALRLYPPLPAISRMALDADVLAGVPIQPRTLIVVAPYVVHRHRLLWENPDAFDPSRFLPGARDAIDPFAYLPFGRGPRGCIGIQFALQEATLALQAIVRRLDLDLPAGQPVWPVHRITLQPRDGLMMRVKSRSAAAHARPAALARTA
jgi:cytochrome P450